ncbi:wall-associated receptor kinase 2-like [Salvia divinorum]|uniref:Wall-associated receptor kinase 2-like n=1 Tax=Salvia divinorum TaxID=28513 RepID=A0ABD1I1F8_SALDI
MQRVDWHLAPEGSQYLILHTKNKFIIKACDVLAYLDDGEELTLGACASACNNSTKSNTPRAPSTGQGLNCCQMDLLKDIRGCSLYVAGLENSTDGCGFFTFIDTDYLHLHRNFNECGKRYTVPVVYEWVVGNKSCNEGNICSHNSKCINSTTHTEYKCICTGGFEGNPYHRDGCTDIDECKESTRHRCLKNSQCFNTEGGYYCLPNRSHMLALIIPLGIGLAVGLPILIGGQGHQVLAVANLVKRCLKVNSRKRPSMKEVAAELDHLRNTKVLNKRDEVELEAGDDETISE